MIQAIPLIAVARLAAYVLLPVFSASVALAQSASQGSADAIVSVDEINSRIDALQAGSGSQAGGKDALTADRQLTLENLKAALARMESAQASQKKAEAYAEALKLAPAKIADLGAKLEQPLEEPAPSQQADLSPARAQLQMATLQIKAVSLRTDSRRIEDALRVMGTRRLAAREELTDLREQLDQKTELVPAGASPMLLDSFKIKADAIRQDLSARIANAEQEILSLPTREAIANARHALVERELRQVERQISDLGRRMDAREQEETAAKMEAAEQAAASLAGASEPLRKMAEDTVALRKEMSAISSNLRKLWSTKDRIHSQLQNITVSRRNADQILAFGRIGEEPGSLLREVAKKLPAAATLQHRIEERQGEMIDARVRQFETEQELGTAADGPAAVERFLEANHLDQTESNRDQVRSLLSARRSALSDLFDIEGRQVESLAEVNSLQTELLQRSSQLRSVLDQRLLWLPSARPIDSSWGRTLVAGVTGLITSENLAKLEPVARNSLHTDSPLRPLLLVLAVVLFALRRHLLRQLEKLSQPIGTRSDRFMLTMQALLVTMLLALPVPLALGLLGSIFLEPYNPSSFPNALGRGLTNVAIVLFILGLFRNMCRHHGLFAAHFGWPAAGVRRLGKALWMVTLAIAPAALLSGLAENANDGTLIEGLGRLSTLISSIALAVFAYQIFKPEGGAMTTDLSREGLIWRTRHLWYWIFVCMPLVLAMLSIAGYGASADALQSRLVTSGWIILVVVIIYQVALRGVLVSGRQAALKQAEARQAKRAEEQIAGQSGGEGGEGAPIQQEEPDVDVVTVSQQTRGILRATSAIVLAMLLWEIWSGLVPALGIFNNFVLWSDVATTATGKIVTEVTLGHVLFSGLLLTLTVFAVRNLPGFLEVVVLHRFDLDSGTRYAYVTILRYLILAIGLVVSFSHIGVDWSKLQWIVAALGVGLGFGLQEIVANFVSGIIILFERPVRVGDLISIDNTVGTVSRIKIRAITITDPDNFEVLVPNKAFITGTVKNWSLTTPITRVTVKVGIAYGSDVGRAQTILHEVAAGNENVLETPAPAVLFLGFGDSSLDLELRAFVGRIDQRLPTLHALHVAVHEAFMKAGIEIPFPQRDLHIRESAGIDGLLEATKSDKGNAGDAPAST
ncbi:mechanosensitive ion channel domain-containing protein [Dokdonella sp.]|uniref:mechanosensitive ion channel domain-containing protein n=1 Tax=Dokdonella sp. TaxID=2291710 RepID=UPI0035279879